jgi:3-oxoacyl-[acyl-carrier-protein] synthase-3
MRYSKVFLDSIGYELAPNVINSSTLEERIAPVYRALGMQVGQLEALTGIRERRWWDPGFRLSEGAVLAGRKALASCGVDAKDLGALIYAGVCREASEPATACAAAAGLGIRPDCAVYDISNACLGVMNGIFELANAIELGAIRAGLVVSCESAREINDSMIESMLKDPSPDHFRLSMATLTGGSGAVAVLLTDGSFGRRGHRLLGGVLRAAPEHHGLCLWRRDAMSTDATAVLKHGVALGRDTWKAFLKELGWDASTVDKTVCHQVGAPHRGQVLAEIGVSLDRDFQTYESLGNIGTVSLPLTAAIADEREFLVSGDKVAFLGIGSGLNCLMLGWEW